LKSENAAVKSDVLKMKPGNTRLDARAAQLPYPRALHGAAMPIEPSSVLLCRPRSEVLGTVRSRRPRGSRTKISSRCPSRSP
jgi:hypothetical protein